MKKIWVKTGETQTSNEALGIPTAYGFGRKYERIVEKWSPTTDNRKLITNNKQMKNHQGNR